MEVFDFQSDVVIPPPAQGGVLTALLTHVKQWSGAVNSSSRGIALSEFDRLHSAATPGPLNSTFRSDLRPCTTTSSFVAVPDPTCMSADGKLASGGGRRGEGGEEREEEGGRGVRGGREREGEGEEGEGGERERRGGGGGGGGRGGKGGGGEGGGEGGGRRRGGRDGSSFASLASRDDFR